MRVKKSRGRPKKSPSTPEAKIGELPVDKVVNYPRHCPACGDSCYSTLCKCGRLTVIK